MEINGCYDKGYLNCAGALRAHLPKTLRTTWANGMVASVIDFVLLSCIATGLFATFCILTTNFAYRNILLKTIQGSETGFTCDSAHILDI